MISVIVNGQHCSTNAKTIAELLKEQKKEAPFMAITVNGSIIPKNKWHTTTLSENDNIDIYAPVGGG